MRKGEKGHASRIGARRQIWPLFFAAFFAVLREAKLNSVHFAKKY
jgi:hypothetical protein